MNIVSSIADHLDVTEYEVFEFAAHNWHGDKFDTTDTDFTLWKQHGILPLYMYAYNEELKKCARQSFS